LMVLGIIVAVVAFVLVIILGGRGGGGSADRNTDVVVAAVDIPAGTQITDQMLKVDKYAADQVPGGAQSKIKDASGQFAAVTLSKSTVVTKDNLVSTQSKLPAQKKPYLDIPSGQVAISIPYGAELQAVSGYIQEGDKIDILYSPNASDQQKIVWKVTFQNLKVAKIGQQSNGAGAQPAGGLAGSMVVFVPVDQSEELSFLFATGQYKLVLKSQADIEKNDIAGTAGVSQPSFNSKYNVPKG
jgi:pilus assembly protein CpaB